MSKEAENAIARGLRHAANRAKPMADNTAYQCGLTIAEAELAAAEIDRLAARIAHLESIVSRLPKTADGKYPAPGECVFSVEGNDIAVRTPCGLINDLPLRHDTNSPSGFVRSHHAVHQTDYQRNKGPSYRPVSECYSTRAAAEAARTQEQEKTR